MKKIKLISVKKKGIFDKGCKFPCGSLTFPDSKPKALKTKYVFEPTKRNISIPESNKDRQIIAKM